ncbi:hypothetical protein JCM11251_000981 [Rhodosporidiobolus azoricus]
MATTPPLSSAAHTRTRSGSFTHALPQPIPFASPPSSALTSNTSPSPSHTLSASLRAFQELSLSPPAPGSETKNPLDSVEFRTAFHHARRTSFGAGGTNAGGTAGGGGGARPIVIPDSAPAAQDAPTPGLSTSPGSEATSGSLPTPSSSPSAVTAATSLPLSTGTTTSTGATTATARKERTASNGAGSKVGKPSSTLLGVCEKDELAMERGELHLSDEDLITPPLTSGAASTGGGGGGNGSGIFAGGARWGWPSSGSTGPLSPPASSSSVDPNLQRRGSLAFASPPSTSALRAPGTSSPGGGSGSSSTAAALGPSSPPAADPFRMMQPLGRVVSAGAALQTPQGKTSAGGGAGAGAGAGGGTGSGGKDGFGLFRRFSISGLGKTRPSAPPPPPAAAAPAPTLAPPVLISSAPSPTAGPPTSSSTPGQPSPPTQMGLQRGRSLGAGSGPAAGAAKGAKRRISPMGEKILRGGY